jgi:hypothetical protein
MSYNLDAFIRPSALEAISLCPGRPTMEAAVLAAYGKPPDADDAALGTLVHALAASLLQGLPEPEECAALNGWDRHCAGLYVDFVRDLAVARGIDADNILVEHHLDGAGLGLVNGGTADCVLVDPFKRVIVIDLKSGMNDQGEAADHDQLSAYAIMAASSFKVDTVEVHIFQPRAEKHLRHSSAKYTTESLTANITWIRSVTDGARESDTEVHASLTACEHCKALPHCAEARRLVMQTSEALKLMGAPTDPVAWGEKIAAGKIGGALDEAIKDIAKPYLEAGGIADGFVLQPGAMMTKIDTMQAFNLAEEAGQVRELMEHATIKAEAAKVLSVIAPAVSKVPKSPSIKEQKR